MITHRPAALVALIATGLLLSACHKKREAPANEAIVEAPLPEAPTLPENVTNAVETAPPAQPKAVAPPDTYQLSEDEQIREDAEASGMTSRSHPGEAAADNAQR